MKSRLITTFRAIFAADPAVVARAPGRIEFIGNHTDYNGGPVLGAALDRSVWVALGAGESGRMRFSSDLVGQTVTVATEAPDRRSGSESWINYPLGVWRAFPEFGLPRPECFDFLALSDLPAGAGLSSSAAIEMASALAFLRLADGHASLESLVHLARRAENEFVGVPCGILDQAASGFGQEHHLVLINSRIPSFSLVALPAEAHFWILNTHSKHALVDSLYARRHEECFEALRRLQIAEPAVASLADATAAMLEQHRMLFTGVLYARARHVVDEVARVGAVLEALKRSDLRATGRLLVESHRSSQQLFENSTPELDFLVDALTRVRSVYGARLTGGGFGGAVMAMTTRSFSATEASDVAAKYRERFSRNLEVLHCETGSGAEIVNVL